MTNLGINKNTLYLIYDGECPLCSNSAQAFNIKKAIGNIVLINAREFHPLVNAAYERGLNPNQGIIVIYQGQFYFGPDAAHFLAILGSFNGRINKIMASLFRFRLLAGILYPITKLARQFALSIKGAGPVKHNDGLPLFACAFGKDWKNLSPLMKRRFSNRPYSNDLVTLNGLMTIKSSRWMRFIKPVLNLTSGLVQQDGENVPVVVQLRSDPGTSRYWYDREFSFSQPERFKSYMMHINNNSVVEFTRFNIGWRSRLSVAGDAIIMAHHGYVFRFFNRLIPIPVSLLIGKCHVVERPISPDTFSLEMNLTHFFLGTIYQYAGIFKIAEEVVK